MVSVVEDKVTFSPDYVVTSSQADKNFYKIRCKARTSPMLVSDTNNGIDTVVIGYEEFKAMALELERLRDRDFYDIAASRVERANSNSSHKSIPLSDVVDSKTLDSIMNADTESISDEELFE